VAEEGEFVEYSVGGDAGYVICVWTFKTPL